MTHPASLKTCNLDMENLITDSNRSIATLAITTLLKVNLVVREDNVWKNIKKRKERVEKGDGERNKELACKYICVCMHVCIYACPRIQSPNYIYMCVCMHVKSLSY